MEQREKKEREKEEKRERKNSIKAEKKERQKREKQEKKKKKDKGQALPDGFQCGGQSQNFGAPNGQEGDGGHLIGECICGFFPDF